MCPSPPEVPEVPAQSTPAEVPHRIKPTNNDSGEWKDPDLCNSTICAETDLEEDSEVAGAAEMGLTIHDFLEDTVAERNAYLEQTLGQLSSNRIDKISGPPKDFYNVEETIGYLQTLRDATFYDPVTDQPLTSEYVLGNFSIARGHHMSNMSLSLRHKPEEEDELPEDGYGDEDEDEDEEDTSDGPIRTRCARTCVLRVNCQSLKHIRALRLDDTDTEGRVPTEMQEIKALPQHMLNDIQRCKDEGFHPILVQLKFNLEQALVENVFLGSGPWADLFAQSVQQGEVKAIVWGIGSTFGKIKTMSHLFEHEKVYHPLDRFYTPNRRRVIREDHLILPDVALTSSNGRLQYDFVTRRSFFDWDEYVTVFGVSMVTEQYARTDQVSGYERYQKTLRLMAVPGSGNNAFYGTLPVPEEENDLRLSPGTKLKITFNDFHRSKKTHYKHEDKFTGPGSSSNQPARSVPGKNSRPTELNNPETKRQSFWSATVIQPPQFCPTDQIPIPVSRAWITVADGRGKEWDPRIVRDISAAGLQAADLTEAFHHDSGQQVQVEIVESYKVSHHNLSSLERLNYAPRDFPATEWNIRMKDLLTGNRAHTHGKMDIYQHLRKQFPQPELFMDLDEDQQVAIRAGMNARQGVQLIQGPGGSGKSHFASEIINLHAQSRNNHAVLIVAPSNKAIDALAIKASVRLGELQVTGRASNRVYYLREFSDAAESQILHHVANETRPKGALARPEITINGDDGLDSINEAQLVLRDMWIDSKATQHKHITDTRVLAALYLSVGFRMLQTAGIDIPGVPRSEITHPDPERFEEFRTSYGDYARGAKWAKDQHEAFKSQCEDLKAHVRSNATAWFATTTHAGSSSLLRTIQERVNMIILDEAGREREDNLFPIMAAGFTRSPAMIMFGDLKQLTPVGPNFYLNPFAKQFETPLMSRLISLGWEWVSFTEQHRMVTEISDMVNDFMYDGILQDAPETELQNRPIAIEFQKHMKSLTLRNKLSSIIFYDLKKSELTQTQRTITKSRHNEMSVIVMITVLRKLLTAIPGASIGLITGYVAQRNHLLSAVMNMRIRKIQGVENVTVSTIDAAQGLEFDIVIMDLMVGKDAGFLADKKRLTVATTRARDGLVIVGCSGDIERLRGRKSRFLRVLVEHLEENFQAPLSQTKEHPKCAFFTPKRLPSRGGIWGRYA